MPRKRICRYAVPFFSEARQFVAREKIIDRVVLETLSFLRVKTPAYLEIFFLKDNSMRALNKKFKKRDKKTTILSFEPSVKMPHPEINSTLNGGKRVVYLGEIYLAPDYIIKKKADMGELVVHGVLHLLGYTHNENRDSIKMEALEKRVFTHLKKIGTVS